MRWKMSKVIAIKVTWFWTHSQCQIRWTTFNTIQIQTTRLDLYSSMWKKSKCLQIWIKAFKHICGTIMNRNYEFIYNVRIRVNFCVECCCNLPQYVINCYNLNILQHWTYKEDEMKKKQNHCFENDLILNSKCMFQFSCNLLL